MIRFVICVDVEAEDVDEAYAMLYDAMKAVDRKGVEWESTDEVYGSNGEAIPEERIVEARMKKIQQIRHIP